MTNIQTGTTPLYPGTAVCLVALQYYVQVEQYGSSNSREHACCIYIVSSHVSALV